MKPKYRIEHIYPMDRCLDLLVVTDYGASQVHQWVRLPYELLVEHDVYDAIARGVDAVYRRQERQRERMDDSLF